MPLCVCIEICLKVMAGPLRKTETDRERERERQRERERERERQRDRVVVREKR